MKTITKMNTTMWLAWWIAMAPMAAIAQQPGAIELKATAEKVVIETDPEGTERTKLVKADLVVPGDRIAYTIAARNVSEGPVDQIVITDPIPEEMQFVPGTIEAEGARVLFSVDGGTKYDVAEKLVVLDENGQARPALPRDFTHIRWIFEQPLDPSDERSVRFVALVE